MEASSKKKLVLSSAVSLSVMVVLFAFLNFYYKDRIAPNVRIGSVDLSNKKIDDAQKLIAYELPAFINSPVTFNVGGSQV